MMGSLLFSLLFLSQATTPTASIEGRILRAGTNEPVPNARVAALGTASTGPYGAVPTITDSEGVFALRGLDPGSYRIDVAADGYARMTYGQKTPRDGRNTEGGRLLNLAAGKKVEGLTVHLTATGTISGRLRDIGGMPAANVPVRLLRAAYGAGPGEIEYVLVASGSSDDRGNYRLYWITPGRYYLSFGVENGPEARLLGINAGMPLYSTTFYPGVLSMVDAKPVEITPAAELAGMDVVLTPAKGYSIRGRVVDTQSGRWPAAATPTIIFLGLSSRGGSFANATYNPVDGTFVMRDIPPGNYRVGVSLPNPSQGTARAIAVTVTNADLDGLVVNVSPNVAVPVNISVEKREFSTITALHRWRVYLQEDLPATPGTPQLGGQISSEPSPSGITRFPNVQPGDYRFQSRTLLLSGLYLKSVKYKDRDVLNEPVRITAEEIGQFDVVLGSNPGQIEGIVRDERNQPAPGLRVVLVPARERARADLYKTVDSDGNGKFIFLDVAPEDYDLFAWSDIEPNSWFDSAVIAAYKDQGTRVHVAEASKESINLRLIE